MNSNKLHGTLASEGTDQGSAKVEPDNIGTLSGRISALVAHFGSVAELARKSGSSETAVRKWIDGAEPARDRCLALAKGTGVSLMWLLGGVPPMWAADMSEAERDTQTIVLGEPEDYAVREAVRRRDAAIRGFTARLIADAVDKTPQPGRPDADLLRAAAEVMERALDQAHATADAAGRAELLVAIYDMLQSGLALEAAGRAVASMLRAAARSTGVLPKQG